MTEANYLNAVVERGESLQLITEEYSRDAVADLLKRGPDAIALAPAGALDATCLLLEFKRPPLRDVLIGNPRTSHTVRWRCYLWQAKTHRRLHFCAELKDERKVLQELEKLSQSLADPIILLVPHHGDRRPLWTTNYEHLLESAMADVIAHSQVALKTTPESRDRKELRTAREELLARVPSFTSEDLAVGGDSISGNASQYALDLRNSGKVFGVRFGRTWHYPKFQFDSRRRPFSEVKQVLAALTPDPKGWDRLQWFVTPHETLKGRTPLQVWKSDRQKVSETANTERWHGRRD